MLDHDRDRVCDHIQVLLLADPQHIVDVHVPGLPDDGDHGRFALEQCLHSDIFCRGDSLASRHPEGGELGMGQRLLADFLEELDILGITQRVPAFDDVDAELIEHVDQLQFVAHG